MFVVVTGGHGFIGAAVVRQALARWPQASVIDIDARTYAADARRLATVLDHPRFSTRTADISDPAALEAALPGRIDLLFHLAAESHVDRGIADPATFVRTNVLGTQVLLDAAMRRGVGHFVYVSTDEVYGEAGPDEVRDEDATIQPGNAYAASKAGAEWLCHAAGRTHGLPYTITRGCNTCGPEQHAEKLIGTIVRALLAGHAAPLYGDGAHVREWIDVEDHAAGILAAADRAPSGRVFNLGSAQRLSNIDVVMRVADALGQEGRWRSVPDRKGHDRRYAMDSSRAHRELGFAPKRDVHESIGLAALGIARRVG